MAEYLIKICGNCNVGKKTNEFSSRKISKDGFRNICKLCESKKHSEWYFKNIEKIKLKNSIWRENNKDKILLNVENFHNKNPNYNKEYNIKNRENINIRNNKRRNTDINFKIKENIRLLIKNSFKFNNNKKNTKTIQILGCSYEEFKQHLESQFADWMNWDNYGNPKDGIYETNKTWDIDHKTPLSSAKTEEDIIRLNHYSNLQPLCSYNNRFIKKDKI